MTATTHFTIIENWVGNKTLFEIIKDRNRVDTIIKDIDNKEGHIHIEVLQFANIFSLYQKLDKQRKAIVERISQTDDWEERLKIGEELTQVEKEEKQFLKNVLHTAHTFADIKLQGVLETVAESFFKGNIEQANTLLNPQKLADSQEKMLQLVQEKLKLEQAYDRLEDNANEFKVKAQLTVLNLDISDADDRFEKTIFYFERGLVSARVTERDQFIGEFCFDFGYFLQQNNQRNKAILLLKEALKIHRFLAGQNSESQANLGVLLSNLARLYLDKSEFKEAENLITESLEIYERLAEYEPELYLELLANTLNNFGILNEKINNFEKVENSYNRTIFIHKKLGKYTKGNYSPSLVVIFNNLGLFQQAKNEKIKAEKSFKESLRIYEELDSKNQEKLLPNVAMTWNNMSSLQLELIKIPDAIESAKSAVEIYKKLAFVNPKAYLPNVATALSTLSNAYVNNSEMGKAEKLNLDALDIFRDCAKVDPQTYLPLVAKSLTQLAGKKTNKGKFKEALKHYEESISIYRNLIGLNTSPFISEFAFTLNNFGIMLNHIKEYDKAETTFKEALEIRIKLSNKHPQVYLPELAQTQINLSIFYVDCKVDKELSIHFIDEAITNLLPFHQLQKYLNSAYYVLQKWGIDAGQYLNEKLQLHK